MSEALQSYKFKNKTKRSAAG